MNEPDKTDTTPATSDAPPVKRLCGFVKPANADIVFDCPHCTKSLEVDASGAGLEVPCPVCGCAICIPVKDESAGGQATTSKRFVTPAHVVVTDSKKQTAKRVPLVAIAVVLICVAVAFGAGLWWAGYGKPATAASSVVPSATGTNTLREELLAKQMQSLLEQGKRDIATLIASRKTQLLAETQTVHTAETAQTPNLGLPTLAKRARPSVVLLVITDSSGKEIGTGTGFFVSRDGKLITNYHVIKKGGDAIAKSEGEVFYAVEGVLAVDIKNDLALLKVKTKDQPCLTLADVLKVEPGQRVAVIGSPLGLEGTLSEGIVSAVREFEGKVRRIQITAAISPGSSGSPVLNEKGEAIGVATFVVRGGQSLNFAVPADAAKKLISMAAEKTVSLASIGSSNDSDDESRGSDEFTVLDSAEYKAVMAARQAQNWTDMLSAAQALVRRFPDNDFSHSCLGQAYQGLTFFDEAVAAYKRAIKIDPNNEVTWSRLGEVYRKQKKYDEAISAYRQAVKLSQEASFKALCYWEMGDAYKGQARFDEAISVYRQAVDLSQDAILKADCFESMGDAYQQQGMTQSARSSYNEALRFQTDKETMADIWYSIGTCYSAEGNLNDATTAFRQAVNFAPTRAYLWNMLALSYGAAGRFAEQRQVVYELRRLNPTMAAELDKMIQPSAQDIAPQPARYIAPQTVQPAQNMGGAAGQMAADLLKEARERAARSWEAWQAERQKRFRMRQQGNGGYAP